MLNGNENTFYHSKVLYFLWISNNVHNTIKILTKNKNKLDVVYKKLYYNKIYLLI